MYKLEVPKALKRGDTIALISIPAAEQVTRICFIDMK